MSERTKELGKLVDTMYAHSLRIESMYEYKVHGPYGEVNFSSVKFIYLS